MGRSRRLLRHQLRCPHCWEWHKRCWSKLAPGSFKVNSQETERGLQFRAARQLPGPERAGSANHAGLQKLRPGLQEGGQGDPAPLLLKGGLYPPTLLLLLPPCRLGSRHAPRGADSTRSPRRSRTASAGAETALGDASGVTWLREASSRCGRARSERTRLEKGTVPALAALKRSC